MLYDKKRVTVKEINFMKYRYIFFSIVLGASFFALPTSAFDKIDVDTDADGIFDLNEITIYHTNPNNPDTDGDGYVDGLEVVHGYSPLQNGRKKLVDVDTDGDKLSDELEIALGTNLKNSDTDADSYMDGEEVNEGYNPLKSGKDKSLPRKAVVDLTNQRLDYYLNGVKIGSMPVSTGRKLTPTPTGEFSIIRKVPVVRYTGVGYDYPNTKWNLEFKRSYYLHGAYWHNQFGIKPMSHGCVNIAYENVEKLYAFMHVGDKVQVVGSAPLVVAKK